MVPTSTGAAKATTEAIPALKGLFDGMSIRVPVDEPVVSADIDLGLTQVIDGDLVKVFAWYDNEYGYSNRLVEQVINIGKPS